MLLILKIHQHELERLFEPFSIMNVQILCSTLGVQDKWQSELYFTIASNTERRVFGSYPAFELATDQAGTGVSNYRHLMLPRLANKCPNNYFHCQLCRNE